MNEFHKTLMGENFFNCDVPKIAEGLEKTWQTLDKAIVALNKLARDMRDKDAGTQERKPAIVVEAAWLVGSTGKNDDIIVLKIYGEMGDTFYIGKRYVMTQLDRASVIVYYVYMDKELMKSPAEDDSYGSLQEAFECIANELG